MIQGANFNFDQNKYLYNSVNSIQQKNGTSSSDGDGI